MLLISKILNLQTRKEQENNKEKCSTKEINKNNLKKLQNKIY